MVAVGSGNRSVGWDIAQCRPGRHKALGLLSESLSQNKTEQSMEVGLGVDLFLFRGMLRFGVYMYFTMSKDP